ncbi:beta-lactamase-like protein [Pisolithus orientalis]|uniref:beta-lactamase-like protein n=1 Tax=Pisolithus orientalis TaxID=936130 RepID=UPI00222545A0|nr:beta-lactamase-like protein [Pisolithus orientalis]KAI6005123.1 beta-lactamase-like protein [Pisolithus orientalis]
MSSTSSVSSIDRTPPSDIELIFLGTGSSSSVPHLDCLTAPSDRKPCKTCLSTLTQEGKKNIRRNTSVVVRFTGKDQKKVTVVIDVGKTFQAAAMEWFPKYGLREIDAVLITHAHADAMNGLDDLRGWTLGAAIQQHIDVYVSGNTFREVERAFPYLVSKEFASGGGDVPEFKWHIIEDKVRFEIKDTGVWITPFLVQHGRLFTSPATFAAPSPCTTQPTTPIVSGRSSPRVGETSLPKVQPFWCFGFVIQNAIVYMSDVSRIPQDAWELIESGQRKSVLVIDCLRLRPHTSHMGIRDAAAAIKRLAAERSYLIGFSHDLHHEEWVTVTEAAGNDAIGLSGKSRPVREGVAMILEEKVSGCWVRPTHDGLRVLVSSDGSIRDETYD